MERRREGEKEREGEVTKQSFSEEGNFVPCNYEVTTTSAKYKIFYFNTMKCKVFVGGLHSLFSAPGRDFYSEMREREGGKLFGVSYTLNFR